MSAVGTIEAEVFRTEQIELPVRTSDPQQPSTSEMWIRVDITPGVGGDSVVFGIVRIQGHNGANDIPIIDINDETKLGSNVYVGPKIYFGEYDRNRIPDTSAVGFLPVAESNASIGSPRIVMPNGNIYKAHDSLTVDTGSAIPDSGVSRFDFEQDVTDSFGGNNLTDQTSAGFSSALAPIGSFAKDFDGQDEDDYVHADNAIIDSTTGNAFSVAFWVDLDSVSSGLQRIVNQNDDNNGLRIYHDGNNNELDVGFENSGSIDNLNYGFSSTNTAEFVCLTRDSSDNATLYRNDANQQATATAASGSDPINTTFGAFDNNGTKDYVDGSLDLVDIYSKELSATEVSNLYNTGSIDG